MTENKNKFFIRAYNNAREMFSSREKVIETVNTAFKKTTEIEGDEEQVTGLTTKVKLFARMIRSYVTGEYREVPFRSILLIFAGLLYFINPFDMIGDFIPGIGYIDDITILLYILKSVEEDVLRYQRDMLDIGAS